MSLPFAVPGENVSVNREDLTREQLEILYENEGPTKRRVITGRVKDANDGGKVLVEILGAHSNIWYLRLDLEVLRVARQGDINRKTWPTPGGGRQQRFRKRDF